MDKYKILRGLRRQRRRVLRSREPGSFLIAAGAAFGGKEFAVMHFAGLVFNGLPLVETGLAQSESVGFGLEAFAAGAF